MHFAFITVQTTFLRTWTKNGCSSVHQVDSAARLPSHPLTVKSCPFSSLSTQRSQWLLFSLLWTKYPKMPFSLPFRESLFGIKAFRNRKVMGFDSLVIFFKLKQLWSKTTYTSSPFWIPKACTQSTANSIASKWNYTFPSEFWRRDVPSHVLEKLGGPEGNPSWWRRPLGHCSSHSAAHLMTFTLSLWLLDEDTSHGGLGLTLHTCFYREDTCKDPISK